MTTSRTVYPPALVRILRASRPTAGCDLVALQCQCPSPWRRTSQAVSALLKIADRWAIALERPRANIPKLAWTLRPGVALACKILSSLDP